MYLLVSVLFCFSKMSCVEAKCDNQCSGHGTCLTDDVCDCDDNYGLGLAGDSGDCSEKICPFEIAWVDNPDKSGRFHKYLECSGKGICNREVGDCECFFGYEGKACARLSCPNQCSGHGTCEFIEDLPYGETWSEWVDSDSATFGMSTTTVASFRNKAKTFNYKAWDRQKSRKCVCDAQWGDVDCSKRMCPYGTDVLDTKDDTWMGMDTQKYQEQTILFAALSGDFASLAEMTFALTFVSKLNETFTTTPIAFSTHLDFVDLENDIKNALLKLPNGVIDGVQVKADFIDQNETASLVKTNLPDAKAMFTWGASSYSLTLSGAGVTTGSLAVGQIVTDACAESPCDIPPGTTVTAINDNVVTISGLTARARTAATELEFTGISLYNVGVPMGPFPGVRGAYTDFSLSKPSGVDRPVLYSTDESIGNAENHRRRRLINYRNTALVTVKIRFTGAAVQGTQHLLSVEDYYCGAGCSPKLTGLPLETRQTQKIWSAVVEITQSDFNSYECGRRGKCDYETGVCTCFAGYIGDNCNTLTTLV